MTDSESNEILEKGGMCENVKAMEFASKKQRKLHELRVEELRK